MTNAATQPSTRTRGIYILTVFKNETNNWSVTRFRTISDNKQITVTGYNVPEIKNLVVDLIGVWGVNKKTGGNQFEAVAYEIPEPDNRDATIAYLCALKCGIGKSKAAAIYNRFGDDTTRIIREEPEKLCQIRGISRVLVDSLKRSLLNSNNTRDLIGIFADANISVSPPQISQINTKLGSNSAGVIRQNPYSLLKIRNFSFEKADLIADKIGFQKDSPMRIEAGIYTVLQQISQAGHVCYPLLNFEESGKPAKGIVELTCSLLGTDKDNVCAEIKAMIGDGRLRYANKYIYTAKSFAEEEVIADRLFKMVKVTKDKRNVDSLLSDYEAENLQLAEEQREAVRNVFLNQVSIITGGPGTGKTTVTKAVLYCHQKVYGANSNPILLAPTGKAARRLADATGSEAWTVHQAVGYRGEDLECDDTLIDANLVIVDESSMLDQYITSVLLTKLKSGTRLVFVGDTAQLPSVGAGNILHDLIRSRVIPTTRLQVIFRQKGTNPIVHNAYEIEKGHTDLLLNDTFRQLEVSGVHDTFITAAKLYLKCVKAYGIGNVLLLNPQRNNTELSTHRLNVAIQKTLHQHPELLGIDTETEQEREQVMRANGITFMRGDRVMQLRNTDVAKNGDVGQIRQIRTIPDPDNMDKWTQVADIEFNEDGKLVTYSYQKLDELDLAYCSTVHKAQGEEYETVIMIVSNAHPAMLKRNLVYTGITRAKQNVAVIGERDALDAAILNNQIDVRYTCLAARLQTLIA